MAMKLSDLGLPKKLLEKLDKSSIVSVSELTSRTEKDILKISGIGKSALCKIKEALGKNNLKLKKDPQKKARISREKSLFIIRTLLKKDPVGSFSWSREVKMAADLVDLYGWSFWSSFRPDFQVNTLQFYFSEKGREILKIRKLSDQKKFLIKDKRSEKLIDESAPKLGKDFIINRKPKTIKEFLS